MSHILRTAKKKVRDLPSTHLSVVNCASAGTLPAEAESLRPCKTQAPKRLPCMFPTKSDVFIIKQSFIKANSVHKSVRAHALQCPKRRHLHCNAKQHNIWVYVTYMCQYSQVLSTIP